MRDGASGPATGWRAHLRGHLLLFEPHPELAGGVIGGARLLLAAALTEIVRIAAVAWRYPDLPLWLLLPGMLGVALLALRVVARVTPSQLGMKPWRNWTVTERSYFVQVLCLAAVVFPVLLAQSLVKRLAELGLARGILAVFLPYFCYGLYQEIVYRGMLQTALARRWGAPIGITIANVLYAFGPLHAYYFAKPASVAVPMLSAIFAVGLFFGLLFHRSGNLWLNSVFHGIGNAFMVLAATSGSP